MLSSRTAILLALIFLVTLAGCGAAKVNVYRYVDNEKSYPLSVAVLPFSVNQDIPADKQPHAIFREVFFNYFSYLGYTDMPLEDVDKKLAAAGIPLTDMESLIRPKLDPRLKEILGVDAVIVGKVTDATNFTGGLHSQTTITARLEMIDLAKEIPVWDTEHTEMAYAGIATPSIVDIIKDQIDNANVQQAYYRLAESFSLKVLNEVPDPAEMRQQDVRLPIIKSIETNIRVDQKFKLNDRIYVSLQGQPGLTASFDIGNSKTGIPMKEIAPGLYTGSYRVIQGDKIDNALIIGTLKNKQGLAGKKIYRAAMAVVEEAKAEVN